MSVDYVNSDAAFLSQDIKGTTPEMTYAGALSFLRRKYTRDLTGADIVVSGVPFDGAVTNRCLLYTSPSPRDLSTSRMPSSA